MSMMSHRIKLMDYSSKFSVSDLRISADKQLSVWISLCRFHPWTSWHLVPPPIMPISMVMKWICSTFFPSRLHCTWLISSVPQSEETRAELSQIAWVPRQVHPLSSLFYYGAQTSDHLSSSKQACHGYRSRHPVWCSKVHFTRQLLRLERCSKHPTMGSRMGWNDTTACDLEAQTFVDW